MLAPGASLRGRGLSLLARGDKTLHKTPRYKPTLTLVLFARASFSCHPQDSDWGHSVRRRQLRRSSPLLLTCCLPSSPSKTGASKATQLLRTWSQASAQAVVVVQMERPRVVAEEGGQLSLAAQPSALVLCAMTLMTLASSSPMEMRKPCLHQMVTRRRRSWMAMPLPATSSMM